MSVHVHVTVKSGPSPSVLNNLRRLLTRMQDALGCARTVRVILVGSRKAHHLNRRFLGRDDPADVLTFTLGEAVEIYINADLLRRSGNYSEHLGYYAIHGLLHGCGFTHHGHEDAKTMEKLEQEWFQRWKASLPS